VFLLQSREVRLFRFFRAPKRAQTVAVSIAQLIQMLSAAHNPERALRRLGTLVGEDMKGKTRVVTTLVEMTPGEEFTVSLAGGPNEQRLSIQGGNRYDGFTLTCALPPQTVLLDLQPTLMRKRPWREARLLYAACKSFPNAVDISQL
jgi:hypothetical protein